MGLTRKSQKTILPSPPCDTAASRGHKIKIGSQKLSPLELGARGGTIFSFQQSGHPYYTCGDGRFAVACLYLFCAFEKKELFHTIFTSSSLLDCGVQGL